MTYDTVIGLEVHTQLSTQSKLFSGAATAYGAIANTQACVIDLGLPGVLPVLNEKVIALAIRFGLSINAEIPPHCVFARKNYFYPDLPKGYQISQLDHPIVGKGTLMIPISGGQKKAVTITRAHLEEDAGKSIHTGMHSQSGVDLNRAGIPLLEIVSEPELYSAEEAVAYLKTLQQLVRALGISDGNMQEGSFRCDVNISLKPSGSDTLGTRAEIKNINSFRFVQRAIEFEIDRQTELLNNGERVIQETRQYDPDKNITRSMRSKEEAHDYRYFPDPDLLPVAISTELIDSIKNTMPELPWEKVARYSKEYQLNDDTAAQLCQDIDLCHYFEAVIKADSKIPPKNISNWLLGDIAAKLKEHHLSSKDIPISANDLSQLLLRIEDHTISNSIAKKVLPTLWETDASADDIIEAEGLKQITDSHEIETLVDKIIAKNPSQVEQYRAGKDKLFSFFVGQVMKATQGKANPKQVNELLKKKL